MRATPRTYASSAKFDQNRMWVSARRAQMVRATSTEYAPWYVVPADHKWFTRLVVAEAIADTMKGLDLRFPTVDATQKKILAAAGAALRR